MLLPTLAKIISGSPGRVSEYLGDGVLAFYRTSAGKEDEVVVSARQTAEKCIQSVVDIINPMLKMKYGIPPMAIGVGIAKGQGIVQMVGLPEYQVPKVFGRPVFLASKLCGQVNNVMLDELAKGAWPKVKSGSNPVVRFSDRSVNAKGENVKGYCMEYL